MKRVICCLLLVAVPWLNAQAQSADIVWFKVARTQPVEGRNETFLAPISDPTLIEQARVLISEGANNGQVGSIMTAVISPGADGINRDLDAAGAPLWNWHVVNVEGFGDFAIEVCDGWPGFVEEDPKAFVINTANRICFWSFTVVEELTAAPPYGIHPGLSAAWYDPSRAGQGMFISIDSTIPNVFVGWFTYDEQGSDGVGGQRWFTAQGAYQATEAELDMVVTTGGRFDASDPVQISEPDSIGKLTLRFNDCNTGRAVYRLADGSEREFPIERLPPVTRC